MKILSIDTASDVCGVAILENDKLVYSLDTNTGRTHSENLMPMIQNAFNKTNLTLNDIKLIVCDIGPGSFTGIRIGVATSKAFHDSLQIPCIGISSLESLAYNFIEKSANSKYICSIIDSKNNNCYFALYELNNNCIQTLIEPQAETIEDTLSILKSYCEDTLEENISLIFAGDGSDIYKDKIIKTFSHSNFANAEDNVLNSYSLGLAGLYKYNLGLEFEEVLPLYLKKPQAQRLFEEKEKNNTI